MSSWPEKKIQCSHAARVSLYALRALPPVEMDITEAHIDGCPHCHQQMARLRPVLDSFVYWPTDISRPHNSTASFASLSSPNQINAAVSAWKEPEWKEIAPGLSYKGLSADRQHNRLTLLVRLAAGAEYPRHRHGGVEELHLLDGELWIDDRKLRPGDYNRAEPRTTDQRVWTETGCTCVLMTSSNDVLL